MIDKQNIISELEEEISLIKKIIDGLELVDSDDPRTVRLAVNGVSFSLFELVDKITSTEIDIYNFLRERD